MKLVSFKYRMKPLPCIPHLAMAKYSPHVRSDLDCIGPSAVYAYVYVMSSVCVDVGADVDVGIRMYT